MTATQEPLMRLDGLTVDFDIGKRYVRALHGVDMAVQRGETLGVVGESGCGKSITWLAALALLGSGARVSGSACFGGRELVGMAPRDLARVRGGSVALIFQDPASALNPVHRIGTQIGEALRLHRGLRGAAARTVARDLLEQVGISNPRQRLNEYPHELSGGMNQRVMIAMALAGQPDLLIADEPTTALDATIQAQIVELLRDIQAETGMAMVIISHDLGVISELADQVAVMYAGRVIEEAPAHALFDAPAHPYTAGLMAALPDIYGPRRRLEAIRGAVPAPDDLPQGCAFAARCPSHGEICDAAPPRLREVPTARLPRRAACERLEVLTAPRPAADPAPAMPEKRVWA